MGQGFQDAGVNLQLKNFKQYLNRLDRIDKEQREAFDKEFKGTGRSFEKVTRAAKDYERQLNRTRQAQDKLARANQLNRNLAQLEARQRRLAGGGISLPGGLGGVGIAAGAIAAAKAIRDTSRESAEAAANFNAQLIGINNLAAGYGQSASAIRSAMREASQGVLSESAIIRAANQALLLGVAQTPEQFEEVTRTALILGRTMGLTATQAIEQFNTALGRKSLLILDNFGISSRAVRAEIEKLAQAKFGDVASGLSQAQRDALFLEAALKVASEAANTIGDEAISAAGDFDRLTASADNLKIALGEATLPLEAGLARVRADLNVTLAQLLAISSAGLAGVDDFFTLLGRTFATLPQLTDIFDPGAFDEFFDFLSKPLDEVAPDLFRDTEEKFKQIAEAAFGISFDPFEKGAGQIAEANEELEQNEELLKDIESALKRAEQLQLSFARAAEDTARKQTRQVDKLNRSQFKDRVEFLNKQTTEFDKFNTDELKSVKEAEKKLNDARSKVGEERLRDQDKLHRQLRQAEDRFNLSRSQSGRRFQLDDRRLRAEGDILGLQTLREDHILSQQENQENFDLQQRQQKDNNKEQEKEREQGRKEQIQALEQDLQAIQDGLDQRRNEFLIAQDKEFTDLLTAQQEQRDELERGFREQAEDRRISQARQLEDLGRSLAEQENLTAEGAAAIAAELETVFGMEGVADAIIGGFAARTKSEFRDLFENVEEIISGAVSGGSPGDFGLGGGTGRELDPFRPLAFDEGGVVPGPRGSPQAAIVHGEETILPTHKMSAPIIPSQRLDVVASGLINVQGSGSIDEAALERVGDMIADAHEEAIRRIARRG